MTDKNDGIKARELRAILAIVPEDFKIYVENFEDGTKIEVTCVKYFNDCITLVADQ